MHKKSLKIGLRLLYFSQCGPIKLKNPLLHKVEDFTIWGRSFLLTLKTKIHTQNLFAWFSYL